VQLIGYADDINIMGRTKRATSMVYKELKDRAKEVGLNINVEKTKAMVQSRRPRGRETLTARNRILKWFFFFYWLLQPTCGF
jgi:hypothetical protein